MLDFYKQKKQSILNTDAYLYLKEPNESNSFFRFQKALEQIASEKDELDLAFSAMVEVNAIGSILLDSGTELSLKLLDRITTSDFVLCCGISESNWGGHLRRLSPISKDGDWSGIKSYVTNSPSSDGIGLVVRSDREYPVYYATWDNLKAISRIPFSEPFLPKVYHEKVEIQTNLAKIGELLLSDYKEIGKKVQKKEALSLISLLFGFSRSLGIPMESFASYQSLKKESEEIFKSIRFLEEKPSLTDFSYPDLKPFLEDILRCTGSKSLIDLHPSFALFER